MIAAAGRGSRMGADKNKLLLEIAGKPILYWTLKAVTSSQRIDWIGIVGQPKDKSFILPIIDSFSKKIQWIDGGNTRQESVQRGLAALPFNAKHVLIHDGARCLIKPQIFDQCADLLLNGQAVIAATKVTDTIKNVDSKGFIVSTPPRDRLWSAQTPQGFSVKQLKEAHSEALSNGWAVTDDASLFERLDLPVRILDAGPSNIKVTTPFDLLIAESLLSLNKEED